MNDYFGEMAGNADLILLLFQLSAHVPVPAALLRLLPHLLLVSNIDALL